MTYQLLVRYPVSAAKECGVGVKYRLVGEEEYDGWALSVGAIKKVLSEWCKANAPGADIGDMYLITFPNPDQAALFWMRFNGSEITV